MGAWSHEPFGNDEACDWGYGLEEVEDLSLVNEALDRVLAVEDYLEAPEASEAVAAIEVLAKLLGRGTQYDAYTGKVDEWVNRIVIRPDAAILAKAKRALERITGENSELRELWEEEGDNEWRESISALQSAIG